MSQKPEPGFSSAGGSNLSDTALQNLANQKAKEAAAKVEEKQVMFNKLQQVWRKKRVKQVMQQELVNKGATAQVAQSYVMSLENDDLQRYQDERADSDLSKRFTR